MKKAFALTAAILLLCVVGGSASAGWETVSLHPAEATGSLAYGVYRGQQAGVARLDGANHAILWSGSAAGWVDLNPAGATYPVARGVYADRQVGYAYIDGSSSYHAGMWNGTAESWMDLNPEGATESYGYGISSGEQVGAALFGGYSHAGRWYGTRKAGWICTQRARPSRMHTASPGTRWWGMPSMASTTDTPVCGLSAFGRTSTLKDRQTRVHTASPTAGRLGKSVITPRCGTAAA